MNVEKANTLLQKLCVFYENITFHSHIHPYLQPLTLYISLESKTDFFTVCIHILLKFSFHPQAQNRNIH